ncbi:MAG: fimbrial assembly protein [Deltaproteobacteria bacterium RIFCSPLOWO2_02_FULL_53_8]|nr:MAG: fimbrial assembly protein [Deltaproteobacteria bacterium RIFCSPLOWO2_02_FULL_53_8]
MSQQINLLNPLLMKQRDFLSLLTMLQALGFIILGSSLFYGYALYETSKLAKQFEEDVQRYNVEQGRLANFAKEFSPQRTNELLLAEVSRLEKELDSKKELGEALKSSAGGSSAGFSEYMRAFSRQIVQGLWLTGFKVAGDGAEVGLSGGVLDPVLLPTYIQRLGKEQIMQGKTFATLKIQIIAEKGAIPRYVEFALHSASVGEVIKSVPVGGAKK